MSSIDALVVLHDVSRRFMQGGQIVGALRHVSCSVEKGSSIAIMGPSGSGKSTLLAIMAQLDQPDGGKISWPAFGNIENPRPKHVSLAFQSSSLLPALTIVENVELPLLILNQDQNRRTRALAALEVFGIAHLADRLPEEISGGQAQRAGIARALVTTPELILLDEPTGQLDHTTAKSVMNHLMAHARKANIAVVIATHDPLIARQMRSQWTMSHGALITKPTEEAAA